MRISTLLSQQIGLQTMTSQESKMLHTMQQLASGRRVLTPADDPLAAAQSVNVAQTQSMNLRLGTNRDVAHQNLAYEESVLTSVTTLLQDVSTRLVEAGNGAYSDVERAILASVLEKSLENLIGQANATDGNGQFLFSGNLGNVTPYTVSGTGEVSYQGDDGARLVQVAQSRQMSTADSGPAIFERAAPGTRAYVAQAFEGPGGVPISTGTATFSRLEIVDPQAAGFGESFDIRFEDVGGVLSYTLTSSGGATDGPHAYQSGQPIVFNGVSIVISGDPAAGGGLEPGSGFSVTSAEELPGAGFSVFDTISDVIAALKTPANGDPVALAGLNNALSTAGTKLGLHLDNVLTVRASVGARMNELQALDDEGGNRDLNYRAQLSGLEDVDYYEASSNLAVQQVAMQAAELAYLKIQNLGLFNRR